MKKISLIIGLCLTSAVVGALIAHTAKQPGNPRDSISNNTRDELDDFIDSSRPLVNLDQTSSPNQFVMTAGKTNSALAHLTPDEQVNVSVYEKVNRSVVNITTRSVRADAFRFETPAEGAGSGSIIDKNGHILTNYHVIEGAREISVTMYDGSTYKADPVGVDPNTDMAVIKVNADANSLFPVELGDSTRLMVGQKVLAIGNPFGLERTLTTGIVSSLNREIRSRSGRQIQSIVQTDAAINPGNSGGPLLDSRGLLVGVNTAIASRTGQSSGIGFAIPVSAVRRVVPQLIKQGRVIRAEIGISRVMETELGLVIATIKTGGPADKAGLKGFQLVSRERRDGPYIYTQRYIDRSSADTIVAIEDKPVKNSDEFLNEIESHAPGETVKLTILRNNKTVNVDVTLTADK